MEDCEKGRHPARSERRNHAEINPLIEKGRTFYKILVMAAAALIVLPHSRMEHGKDINPLAATKQTNLTGKDDLGEKTRLPKGCFWGGSSYNGKGAAIYCYAEEKQKDKKHSKI